MPMTQALKLIQALEKEKNPAKAVILSRFFKTGKGEYGCGDTFWGITIPTQRAIAKQFIHLSQSDIVNVLYHPVHEVRMTALLILVAQYKKTQNDELIQLLIKHKKQLNNWDFVDCVIPSTIGMYLLDKPKNLLYELVKSQTVWDRRISVLATYPSIKRGDFRDILALATLLLDDSHDLMHKAVGWMLREVGKKDTKTLQTFLNKHTSSMPRTMLRYAIEKFDEQTRQHYLKIPRIQK